MASFPSSPVNGQRHQNYLYNGAIGAWEFEPKFIDGLPLGISMPFYGNSPPAGWMWVPRQAKTLSRSQYSDLWNTLGNVDWYAPDSSAASTASGNGEFHLPTITDAYLRDGIHATITSVDTTNDVISLQDEDGNTIDNTVLRDGTPVRIYSDGTLPGGITDQWTVYYLRWGSGNSAWQLRTTEANAIDTSETGALEDLTSTGSGNIYATQRGVNLADAMQKITGDAEWGRMGGNPDPAVGTFNGALGGSGSGSLEAPAGSGTNNTNQSFAFNSALSPNARTSNESRGKTAYGKYIIKVASLSLANTPATALKYDTGWVANSNWTNAELTVTHNLSEDLYGLIVEFFVSSDGTDANGFLVRETNRWEDASTGADQDAGYSLQPIDNTSFKIQTAAEGVSLISGNGSLTILGAQSWYYRCIVYKPQYVFSTVEDTQEIPPRNSLTRDPIEDQDDTLPLNAEYFPLDGITTISSAGREPVEKSGLFPFPARLTENGYPVFDSPYTKWTGHGVYGFFKHPGNLFSSPEDLTDSNLLTLSGNGTIELTDQYVNGYRLTALISDTSGNDHHSRDSDVGVSGNAPKVIHGIAKKRDSNEATLLLWDASLGTERGEFDVDFSTQSVTAVLGSVIRAEWFDSETVEFWGLSTAITGSNTNDIYIYAENRNSGTTSALGTYWTAIMALDADYAYPYVKDVATPSFLQYSYEWPNQFTVECWVRPWFNYDDSQYHALIGDREGSNDWGLLVNYSQSLDQINVLLGDGAGTVVTSLTSSTFTSNAQLQTWLHLKVVVDLVNDECYLYVDGVLEDSDTVTGLSTVALNNTLHIGEETPHDVNAVSNSLITDLLIISGINKTSTHYSNDRPYYQSDRQVGKNGAWSLDRYGNARYSSLVIPKHLDTARADTDWHVIGQAGEPDYKNGWTTGGFGFGLRWRKFPSGLVIIQALVLDASSATDGVVMTMEDGYVPSETTEGVANNFAGSPDVLVLMSLLKNGDVRFLQDGNTPSTTSIRGSLIYYAEQ